MNGAFRRLFSEGFRVFFLLAGVTGVALLLIWEVHLVAGPAGALPEMISAGIAAQQWHAHELVFGYASAALAGFLLTAVPNWTGTAPAGGRFILTAALLWLLGRIAIMASAELPWQAVAVLDLAFVPLLVVRISLQLLTRPKPQNAVFVVFLTLYWCANLAVHLGWAGLWEGGEDRGLRAGLMALAGMILVIGGRITPAFTRNAMQGGGLSADLPADPAFFAPLMILAALALPVTWLALGGGAVAGAVAIAAGSAQLARQTFWRAGFAWRQPILATLHVSIALVAIGLLLTGLARFAILSELAGLHVLGIGGVGGMTLAVMSRATLGHGGRPLIAPLPVALAYGCLPVAAFLRWLAAEFGGALHDPATLAAGLLWIAAFALFTVALWPVFWGGAGQD